MSTRVAGIPEGQTRRSSSAMGTDQSARTQPGNAAGPSSTEPVMLVRFAVYCQRDHDSAGTGQHDSDSELGTGRFFLVREVAHLRNQADIDSIGSLGRAYEAPGVSSGLREQIKAAAADYAATWVEDQWGTTWWQTPESFPFSQATDFFDGSADWLRGLVEHPVAGALSLAGADGPAVPVGAGITAGFVTARVTAPLEGAARMCEIAGIVIGALTGAHVLVMACAKRFAHDEASRLLGRGFEQVINSIERSLYARPDSEIERPESSAQIEPGASRQPRPSHDAERGNRLTRPGRSKGELHRESETARTPRGEAELPRMPTFVSRHPVNAPYRHPLDKAPAGTGDDRNSSSEEREPGSGGPHDGRIRRERRDEDEPGISRAEREPGSGGPHDGRIRRERADEDGPGRDTSRDRGDDMGCGGDR